MLLGIKNPQTERKLLQYAVGLCACIPLITGFLGLFWGEWLSSETLSTLTVSKLKFLSGMLFVISIGLFYCVIKIETKLVPFGYYATLLIGGGIPQLGSLSFGNFLSTVSSLFVAFNLLYSLVIIPCIYIWLFSFCKRYQSPETE